MKLAERDAAYRDDQHMSKVFAANPEFGSRLYGARNDAAQNQRAMRAMALEEQEIARKQRQREALASLAQTVGGNPNINPVDALVQFASVTGEVDPLSDLFVAREKARSGIDSPAAVKLANEIQQARSDGNFERLNDLILSAKLVDKGVLMGPDGARVMEGYPSVLTTLEEAKQTGSNISDLTYKPRIAGEEAGARTAVELENAAPIAQATAEGRGAGEASIDLAKKSKNAGTAVEILDKAETLLPKATGSVLGAVVSAGKGAIGKSDEKTQADSELELLSGWLVSNVPRMEGPQSDFDVQNYKNMAADLGNRSKPIGDRMAALRGLRDLQKKYASKPKAAPLSVDDLGLTEMSDEDILRALGGP